MTREPRRTFVTYNSIQLTNISKQTYEGNYTHNYPNVEISTRDDSAVIMSGGNNTSKFAYADLTFTAGLINDRLDDGADCDKSACRGNKYAETYVYRVNKAYINIPIAYRYDSDNTSTLILNQGAMLTTNDSSNKKRTSYTVLRRGSIHTSLLPKLTANLCNKFWEKIRHCSRRHILFQSQKLR